MQTGVTVSARRRSALLAEFVDSVCRFEDMQSYDSVYSILKKTFINAGVLDEHNHAYYVRRERVGERDVDAFIGPSRMNRVAIRHDFIGTCAENVRTQWESVGTLRKTAREKL